MRSVVERPFPRTALRRHHRWMRVHPAHPADPRDAAPQDAPAAATGLILDLDKARARSAYELVADRYDDPALGFWRISGERTIGRLELQPGMHVLDVASGSGAAALPAARAVGPEGRVIAVDLSERMLARASDKARRADLGNIDFRVADMTATGYPDGRFDAVVCVFGIFLVPDMAGLVRELWRMVRPGGQLAVTTWGPRLWAPMYDVWRDAVHAERPDLASTFNPWDRVTDPTALAGVLVDGGVPASDHKIVPELDRWPLRGPRDWWSIVMGSGLRWTMEQLDPEAAARVRETTLDHARRHAVDWVTCNALYATATKPG